MHKLLAPYADSKKASAQARFFKTGKGEYGEGDQFLGVAVPTLRKIAKENADLSLKEITKLLRSPFNDERSVALFILVLQFQKGDESTRKSIIDFYLKNLLWVNNWNLVDLSAPSLLGVYLQDQDRTLLKTLSKSPILWERRVAIVSTYGLIRVDEFKDTLLICERLLGDKEDLIHKACGWMLREVGKRDEATLTAFLNKHATRMPRTMLRYAIEKFTPKKRQFYLDQKFTGPKF